MFLFFDTETTGVPKNYKAPVTDLDNWPRVVQLAFMQTDDAGEEITSRKILIKPDGFVIPDEACAIHKITNEMALADGVPILEALNAFHALLLNTTALIGHNISYDENVLGAEFLRAGLINPIPAMRKVCTMHGSTDFCKIPGKYGNFKWPKLVELHEKLFMSQFDGAHDALADVAATAKCFFELKSKGVIALQA